MIVLYWGRTDPGQLAKFKNGEDALRDAHRDLQAARSEEYQEPRQLGKFGAVTDAQFKIKSAQALIRLENSMSAQRDNETAKVLGYTDDLNEAAASKISGDYNSLLSEIREPRFYVMVVAHDIRELKKNRKKKTPTPKWVTRFSIRTRGNNFMDSVAEMALRAGKYFGRNSNRLIRDYHGAIQIGEIQPAESETENAPNLAPSKDDN